MKDKALGFLAKAGKKQSEQLKILGINRTTISNRINGRSSWTKTELKLLLLCAGLAESLEEWAPKAQVEAIIKKSIDEAKQSFN